MTDNRPQQDVTPSEPVSATPGPVDGDNVVEVTDNSVDGGDPEQTNNAERKIDGEQDVSQDPADTV